MARNIEIKANASNFSRQLELARQLSDKASVELIQRDTFFNCSDAKDKNARLKLREFPDQDAQLIYYQRANEHGPKLSNYHISHTPNPNELKLTLAKLVGEIAVVEKVRTLLIVGRTRLHFDQVKSLGNFIELEVVLGDNDDIAEGENEAQQLMQQLEIQPEHLIQHAYVDLLVSTT